MLTFEEFKKSLGDEADDFTDEQIEHIRVVGYQLADAFFEQWLRKRNASNFIDKDKEQIA
jgi:hypothetical protein